MTEKNEYPVSQRHARYYVILVLLTLILIGSAVFVLRQVTVKQELDARHIVYVATATRLAQPTTVISSTEFLPPTVTSLSSVTPYLFPTSQDMQILPTPSIEVTLPAGALPPATPIPHSYDLVNFLVLGADRWGDDGAYRTDVIMIVSVNRTTQTVNFLSVPRDLYVYIPGWGMDRINAAELFQLQTRQISHPLGLLAETVEYNLGIAIHHIARIDFDNFRFLIDSLGGLTIPVDCPVSGYRLASPDLDPNVEANWQPFTLESGIHQMDGALALWYVRQRLDSSDFERNRRQQIVLRALWQKTANRDLFQDFPALWDSVANMVETDLTLDQALSFIPLLLALDSSRVEGHFLGLDEVNLWRTPDGANVLIFDPIPFQTTMRHFLTPPTNNRLVQERAQIDVLNNSIIPDADQLAAARLGWMGFVVSPRGGNPASEFPRTTIYDHTGRTKGSSLNQLQATLRVADADIVVAPASDRNVDFTVVIGDNYISCATSAWQAFPQPE